MAPIPKPCSVQGCPKMTSGYRKMCGMHQARMARHGDVDFERVRRLVTETQAWCNKGQHMVAHDGFAKGQRMCKACRKVYNENNYSLGKTCADCGKRIVNKSEKGRCRACHSVDIRGKNITVLSHVNAYGYVLLHGAWGHPNANRVGQILEHVKVMSDHLGRGLIKGENVHHLNGVRDDNRIENLEIWSTSQPSGQRVPDKVAWAKELLALYEPEALAVPQLRFVEDLPA